LPSGQLYSPCPVFRHGNTFAEKLSTLLLSALFVGKKGGLQQKARLIFLLSCFPAFLLSCFPAFLLSCFPAFRWRRGNTIAAIRITKKAV